MTVCVRPALCSNPDFSSSSSKGQMISEENLCVFNSSKKRTKNFGPSRLGQKFEFSRLFLEELEAPKFLFEIN